MSKVTAFISYLRILSNFSLAAFGEKVLLREKIMNKGKGKEKKYFLV